jgi:hypothetical protein
MGFAQLAKGMRKCVMAMVCELFETPHNRSYLPNNTRFWNGRFRHRKIRRLQRPIPAGFWNVSEGTAVTNGADGHHAH